LKIKHAPLFATKNGKPIEIRNVRSYIDKAIVKAKLRDTCVNDLRNTFIVYQLLNGMSISKLAEIVGHKSTMTTIRYLELLSKKYKPSGMDEVAEL
jgi:site-specific recombinase XerD